MANLATTLHFFHLNKKRSSHRYLVLVLGCRGQGAAEAVQSIAARA